MARGLRTCHFLCEDVGSMPGLSHWVKDPVLPQAAVLLWLWRRLAAAVTPGNLHMPGVWP